MGLPMFREPGEDAAGQAAIKLDRNAATRRSSIRRESTLRPGRRTTSRSVLHLLRADAQASQEPEHNRPSDLPSRIPAREINDLDDELERLRSMRRRRRAIASQLGHELPGGPFIDPIEPEVDLRGDIDLDALAEAGMEVFLSDAEGNLTQHLPRPSRESGLRFEVAATPSSDSEHSRRARFHTHTRRIPSSTSGGRRAELNGHLGSDAGDDNDSENPPPPSIFPPGLRNAPSAMRGSNVDGLLDTPPPGGLHPSYPPLWDVNHLSTRPLGMSTSRMDGLGDRVRSPSPSSPQEEPWSNILNTIATGPSSTATSFMSRSDSRSGSNRSSQTVATSFGEIGGDDSCDLDLPSGITEEDAREIRARHGRLRHGRLGRRLPAIRPDGPTSEEPERPSRESERLLELELFGLILDRMQRREEIPDDMWAAVGISADVIRARASGTAPDGV
ncbi:uncharacterized protein PV06_05203 [Exophiala oligosperma]|uniref:Uncharacterized protein n=1 Tax=Exophiala oligosperma TaxID=215243 RepID=A0A0D2DMI6_9EURO|nr:uncharacterized protein PV06_05203 [Exophiala oligosperma]KIW44173.1 hypothetical protein PV06_05203 [Exophiala oligosperma]